MTPALTRFDDRVDVALDRIRGYPAADRAAYALSALADFSLLWHLAAAAQSFPHPDALARTARAAAGIGLESVLVNQGLKRLFRRARPVLDDDRPFELRTPRTSSFPSGHASAAFFAATVLSNRAPQQAPAWFLLATAVAGSRAYVRDHHASDVVAGVVTGLALAQGWLWVERRLLR